MRVIVRFVFLILFLAFFSFVVVAQEKVKEDHWHRVPTKIWDYNPNPISYFQNSLVNDGSLSLKPYDSLMEAVYRFDPNFNFNRFTQNLGSIGRASNPMTFGTGFGTAGFNYGRGAYDGYMYTADSVRFYNNKKYFTSVSYVMGNAKENVLHLLHNQNLHKGLYICLDYRLINRKGRYLRERVDDNSLSLTMRYFTKSNVYGVYGGWVRNRIKNEENGGIKNDRDFKDNLETVRDAIEINLPGADSKVKNDELFFTQYVSIFKRDRKTESHIAKDSARVEAGLNMLDMDMVPSNDSLRFLKDSLSLFGPSFSLFESDKDVSKHVRDSIRRANRASFSRIDVGRFVHSFSFKTNRFITTEAPYPNADPSTSAVSYFYKDSVNYYTLNNLFAYTNADFFPENKLKNLVFLAGVNIQYIKLNHFIINPVDYLQFIPKGMVEGNFAGFKVKAAGSYVAEGYNNGDFEVSGFIRKSFRYGKKNSIAFVELYGGYSQRMPDYFLQVSQGRSALTNPVSIDGQVLYDYSIKDYFWYNDFEKIKSASLGLRYKMKDFEIGTNVYSVSDFVFFGRDTLPEQFNGNVKGFNVYTKFKIKFWKFDWDNHLIFQMNDNVSYLKLPVFAGFSSLYCTFKMFRKLLDVRIGIDAYYNTAYAADNYLAAINSYYLQNENFMVGNYPYIDLFVSVKVKRAILFLKYNHINKGLMGYNYYFTPHYPFNDGGIHFGVTWRFYD